MRWIFVASVFLAAGCYRAGFETTGDGDVVFDGTAAEPFGGATAAAVTVEDGSARLVKEVGFDVRPTGFDQPLVGAAATAMSDGILFSAGSRNELDGFPSACSNELVHLDLSTGQLRDAGQLPHANQGHGMFLDSDGGLVMVMGCCNCPASTEELAFRRSSGASLFQDIATFPVYAYSFAAASFTAAGQDRVVVAGGRGSGPLRDAVQVLDVSSGTVHRWTEDLPTPRCLNAGAMVGSTFLTFGGHTHPDCTVRGFEPAETALDEIVAIDTESETVSTVGRLPQPLGGACAVTVPSGDVMVFGGFNYAGGPIAVQSTVYRVDPVTHTVTEYPEALPAPRAGMACVVDTEGNTVLAGGIDDTRAATSSLWLFEPFVAEGSLTSSTVDAGRSSVRWHAIGVDADTPTGTAVDVEVRISDRLDVLESAPWYEVSRDLPRGRYLQWRVLLRTTNPAFTPVLHSVQLAYSAL